MSKIYEFLKLGTGFPLVLEMPCNKILLEMFRVTIFLEFWLRTNSIWYVANKQYSMWRTL